MNNITFHTDTTEVLKMIDYFKNSDWISAEGKALRKAANAVKKYNRDRAKLMLPKAMHRSAKYSDRLIDAIRSTKLKKKPNQLQINVHTMGTRNKTSGTFRARFFNNSKEIVRETKPFTDKLGRFYKNGRKTGTLRLIHFFDANPDKVVASSLDEEIKKNIEAINNRKYNK